MGSTGVLKSAALPWFCKLLTIDLALFSCIPNSTGPPPAGADSRGGAPPLLCAAAAEPAWASSWERAFSKAIETLMPAMPTIVFG